MFPAAAARDVGLGDVPLLCARELDIDGGTPLCIRVLMHLTTERSRDRAAPRLPRGRRGLRDDLPESDGRGRRGVSSAPASSAVPSAWRCASRAGTSPAATSTSERAARALELGALDAVGTDAGAEITFVATPVSAVAEEARAALAGGGVVTDVGSVKGRIVAAVDHPASSAATPWPAPSRRASTAPTPTSSRGRPGCSRPRVDTDAEAYTLVRSVVSSLGADVVALPPERHDELVAAGLPRPPPDRGHPDGPGRRRGRGARGRCCAWPPAASGT